MLDGAEVWLEAGCWNADIVLELVDADAGLEQAGTGMEGNLFVTASMGNCERGSYQVAETPKVLLPGGAAHSSLGIQF